MPNVLTRKLEQFIRFDETDRSRLAELFAFPTQTYAARQTILAEGHKVGHIHLVTTGLAARSKDLPGGERQIMAFLIPGDLCDVEVFVLDAMDHDIVALVDTTCVLIPTKVMEELLGERSNITRAMWWSTMTDSAVLRERIIDHGRRGARERLAHMFYELLVRYRVVGLATGNTFPFAINQQELADASGLSVVHVNRTLQELREEGLIEWRRKVLTVPDPKRLKEAARFEARYLHLRLTEEDDPRIAQRAGDLI